MSKIVESVQILFYRLGSLGQLREFSNLHFHHTQRNIISLKGGAEAVLGDWGPV